MLHFTYLNVMNNINLDKYQACVHLRVLNCSYINTLFFQILFAQIKTHWRGFQENRISVNRNDV